jgi:hypothetical protein
VTALFFQDVTVLFDGRQSRRAKSSSTPLQTNSFCLPPSRFECFCLKMAQAKASIRP